MTLRDLLKAALIPMLALGVVACSDDDDNPVNAGDEVPSILVDASSYDDFTYVNLSTGETVTDDSWHLAFRRDRIQVNGGSTNASGTVTVADLTELGLADSADIGTLSAVPGEVTAENWTTDEVNLVFDGWYDYDPINHIVSPSGRVFSMHDATGDGYAKVTVTDITAGGMGALASASVKYVHNATGDDLSGAATTVDLTADGSGMAYLSFSEGQVTATDEWDLYFDNFDVHVNGGTSGSGNASVYAGYDDPELADFDALTVAMPDQGASYETDSSSGPLTSWYEYMGPPTHELRSWDNVYLVTDGTATFKLLIESYYHPADAASGWYTVLFDEL